MRTYKIVGVVVLVLAGAVLFWLGRWSYSRSIVVYSVHGNRVAVHLDWPTSGLPLAEYRAVLLGLRAGLTNEPIGHLETFLDGAVYSAKCRRPVLPDEDVVQLDKAFSAVAQYRSKYPRPLAIGSGFYWTAEKQSEVDKFLEGFRSTEPDGLKEVRQSNER